MPRRRTIAIGALAAALAVSPFLPNASTPLPSISGSGSTPKPDAQAFSLDAATAGAGEVTPAMQAEIDRVIAAGWRSARPAKALPSDLATSAVRCATFEGQRYCLHTGWTTSSEAEVQRRTAVAARTADRTAASTTATGDQDALATLRRYAAMSPLARAKAERAELTAAAKSVAKVWLTRHLDQGVALPTGFLARHPEVRVPTAREARAATTYPEKTTILDPEQVAEQTRTYYCGPTSMQMIEWGWSGTENSQEYWAKRLGTTTSGSSIYEMVRVTNEATGYDNEDRAGTYITLDIGDYTWPKWWQLQVRHIAGYRAPVILHPILLKRFYPYLDEDASGHYQVGRGYNANGDDVNLISFFEPWNQARFDPSEPSIARVQWRQAYKSYRANLAHPAHNIGV
ncbi:C39 family peptidase [Nocardioides speluncae]|uniref:C39 family peptidase n=1 Tax=Nocardioides speluncae TaxID=2670337 RepID=UPI000D6A051F|nr:C39 family peptidase [Nocardioides speluncae]